MNWLSVGAAILHLIEEAPQLAADLKDIFERLHKAHPAPDAIADQLNKVIADANAP